MPGHDIIVVGASAGGVEALLTIARNLPADLPAAVFIVLHIPAQSPSMLPLILRRVTSLAVEHPSDRAPIEHGHVYVAPPDHHLLVGHGFVRVIRGPRENRHRPAVDPLFRTAARFYGPRAVGVVLTGSLDDGTAGLQAIKRRGGVAIVQDPEEAFYPSMPRSAIAHVAVDHVLPLAAIAPMLSRIAREPAADEGAYPVPDDMDFESRLVAMDPAALASKERPGQPSEYSCPECGGVLHEIQDGPVVRFRCRVGHAFSTESVIAEQSTAQETALWTALNTLEESIILSRRLAEQAHVNGREWLEKRFREKMEEAQGHAETIRKVLLSYDTQPELAMIEPPEHQSGPGQPQA